MLVPGDKTATPTRVPRAGGVRSSRVEISRRLKRGGRRNGSNGVYENSEEYSRLQGRGSPRETVEEIVDCGRLAATAMNVQPWQFVAVTDADMRRRIADITDHGKFHRRCFGLRRCLLRRCEVLPRRRVGGTQNILTQPMRAVGLPAG